MKTAGYLNDKTIIVADTDDACLRKIREALRAGGFGRLVFAKTGAALSELLRTFHRKPQDLSLIILSDPFPGCNVYDFCRSLGTDERGAGVPLVILSEGPPCPDLRQIARRGEQFVQILGKPVSERELVSIVNCALHLKKERDLRCVHEERLISELAERKVMEARLKYLVSHDELTGLANRRSLEQTLNLAIQRAKSVDYQGALLYVDIDRFNILNDLEGYDVGDRLLVEVVALIREVLRHEEYLSRIGSDEFCVYVENADRKGILDTAECLRKALDEYRFITGTVCYRVSASIGVAFFGANTKISHPTELIAHAHQACYVAKKNGRNMVWVYNHKDVALQKRQRDIYWVPLIREALLERRLFLVFQPVVRLTDGLISHYEVLLRMRGKEQQVIMPDNFIPVAERMGLIHSIDLWVVENAIDFLASLPDHQSHVALTINLSGKAFQDRALLPLIKQKLDMTWIEASRITFEITETAAVENYQQTRDMVTRIRAIGCHFALDDFGSGFSSFNYIKNFPVDYLKIDGQFIANLANDETDQVLVKAMNDIAHNLGKYTIAEFVENATVLKRLQELGIDYVQGYLLGKPALDLISSSSIDIETLLAQVGGARANASFPSIS